jgi:hypothetical protein
LGYSIGHWIDTSDSGRYDALEGETRNFKGSRVIDLIGIPTYVDNQSTVEKRIYLDISTAMPGLLVLGCGGREPFVSRAGRNPLERSRALLNRTIPKDSMIPKDSIAGTGLG